MTYKDKQPIQQPVTALVPTIVHVTISLPTHIPRGSDHQSPDGGQHGIHLDEVHLEELYWENHISIHLLDLMDGQHLTHVCLYHHGINHLLCNLCQN
jgi:hypothetical protein